MGVWLVTGVQAAGKSTVADLLARQFDRGVHVRGGQFYRWAVRGWVHPGAEREAEARRLLDLRYRLSATVADEYCGAGFTVVVQDNIFGADVVAWLHQVNATPRHLVVLRPSADAVRARDAARRAATGKVAYRPGEFTIEGLDHELGQTPRIGLWLDTSAQTAEQTVAEILRRRDEALIREGLDGSTGELYPERAWYPAPAHLTATAPSRYRAAFVCGFGGYSPETADKSGDHV